MLKSIAAIAIGSTLVLAPMAALADESTTPPKADTVKTPGNGPDVKPMMHMHHHHHHHHMMPMKHHTMMKKPMMKKPMMDKPADAPKT
jgi:hypothetical protein